MSNRSRPIHAKQAANLNNLPHSDPSIPAALSQAKLLGGLDHKSSDFDKLFGASVNILKREHSDPRIGSNEKTIALVGLIAGSILDLGKATPKTNSSHLSRARKIAAAALIDCEVSPEALACLVKAVTSEGFASLVEGDPAGALIHKAKVAFHQTRKVYAITKHIVRCAVYLDPNSVTIEDAKAFVEKWEDDCGISKISKIWERYRRVAPLIYALHLERSFRPLRAVSSSDVINWGRAFVARQDRLTRLLGHGAFALDVLMRSARDQREADFDGVKRVAPPVRPFSSEERLIMDGIDRAGPLK